MEKIEHPSQEEKNITFELDLHYETESCEIG